MLRKANWILNFHWITLPDPVRDNLHYLRELIWWVNIFCQISSKNMTDINNILTNTPNMRNHHPFKFWLILTKFNATTDSVKDCNFILDTLSKRPGGWNANQRHLTVPDFAPSLGLWNFNSFRIIFVFSFFFVGIGIMTKTASTFNNTKLKERKLI